MFGIGIQSFIKVHFLENPIVQVDYKPFQFQKNSVASQKNSTSIAALNNQLLPANPSLYSVFLRILFEDQNLQPNPPPPEH